MRASRHWNLDDLWRIMHWDVHHVVDDFGWWCWDWNTDWHSHVLDVRDRVVMGPVSHLGVAPNHSL
eukprot:CAMPEP_0114648198 /NCGR_PEP_ID=MMETSP0191-20121206/6258_1 /TAXON_ID=126664 /ORGANISM="Sorites sp." /LENGTH=65 /DNA_ID=CAMNT_0001861481 /DNA_START=340 /DNA_END=534 /DNA_ORIENTATION=-